MASDPVRSAEEATPTNQPVKRTRKSKAVRFVLEPAVLTVEETAKYLRVSRQTAYNMAAEGRLPIIRPVPGTIRVVKLKLDELLLNGTLGNITTNPWLPPASDEEISLKSED